MRRRSNFEVSKIVVAVKVVPRVQNKVLLTTLYQLTDELKSLDSVILSGKIDEDGITDMLIKALGARVRFYWENSRREPEGIGRDFVKLIESVDDRTVLTEKAVKYLANPVGGRSQYVLFMDDDCVLTPEGLRRMLELVEEGGGVIGLQSILLPELPRLHGVPSFDPFCSLVPLFAVKHLAKDERMMGLLGLMNFGGDLFALDWYFRYHLGIPFNTMIDPVLHLYYRDKVKVWGHLPAEWWPEVYREIQQCQTLEDLRDVFDKRKLLGILRNE